MGTKQKGVGNMKKDGGLLADDWARLPHVYIIPYGMDVKYHAVQPTKQSLIKQKEKVDAIQEKVIRLNLERRDKQQEKAMYIMNLKVGDQ